MKSAINLEAVFHEWHGAEGDRFFAESGIRERDWRFLMMHRGVADGKAWSFREIARGEGISHVRVSQLVHRAERRLKAYCEKQGA